MVANSDEEGAYAICSEDCAELYNLKIVEKDIQDNGVNFTRFICISKKLEIFKGADKISVMTALEHKVGTLNNLLSRFYTQGLNLTKLESRPVGGGDFEFMFYFDFVGDVESDGVLNLLADLEKTSDKFVFLGSYKENI
jgi:chorismate mutase/prephenate dehydratase